MTDEIELANHSLQQENQKLTDRIGKILATHRLERGMRDFKEECQLVEIADLKRIITKLGKRLKMVQQANKALAAHNYTLVTLQSDRGINCDRLIRGDRAIAKTAAITAAADGVDWEDSGDVAYTLRAILEVLNES
jgi:hypothetical protein